MAVGALVTIQPAPIHADDGAQLVDDLHAVFGKHHARAVRAKGVILYGIFTPTEAARTLSKAPVFAGATVSATMRFSDFAGLPDIADNVDGASRRGLGIKFQPKGDAAMDVVTHSFNGFPTATAAEFGALLRAIASSAPGVAKPTPLDRFLQSHPIAKTFLTTQKPLPASYATTTYFGVNSVALVNETGERRFARFRFVPQTGERYLDEASRRQVGPNYLAEEIADRITSEPIKFDWYAQLAVFGDKIEDPSSPWPEARVLVRLGTITVEHLVPDQQWVDKRLLFMPGVFPNGIEGADPMFSVRNAAYPLSYHERQ